MGLNDFLQAVGRVGSRGKGGANSAKTNAHVSDFNRNELENASRQYQQPEPGALGTFLDNLSSFFRPAGTLGAATYDAVGGEGALTRDIGKLREGSALYKGSDFSKAMSSIPIVGPIVDTALNAPTGDFKNTLVGKGVDKFKERSLVLTRTRTTPCSATCIRNAWPERLKAAGSATSQGRLQRIVKASAKRTSSKEPLEKSL